MTRDEFLAAGRHVISVAAGMGVVLGLLKAGDTETLMKGLSDITTGVGEIMVVVGPLIGGLMAWYAAKQAGLPKALSTVAAVPDTTVVTPHHITKLSRHPNVVSSATHTVVPNEPKA